VTIDNGPNLYASAYQQSTRSVAGTTLVLLNTASTPQHVELRGLLSNQNAPSDKRALLTAYTSRADALWQMSRPKLVGKVARLELPARSLLTVIASVPRANTQLVRK
jgi:hypothetical protein